MKIMYIFITYGTRAAVPTRLSTYHVARSDDHLRLATSPIAMRSTLVYPSNAVGVTRPESVTMLSAT